MLFEYEASAIKDRKAANERDRIAPGSVPDVVLERLEENLRAYRSAVREQLESCLRYPPGHVRHFSLLEQFHEIAPFEKSVFIMTKYPEGDREVDRELRSLIDCVKFVVKTFGCVPRLANERNYHDQLWDNVELCLLGSSRAIAIVEDKCMSELNPNVAMEWGWMRCLRRPVLYLVEESFDKDRADWSGLIKAPFAWPGAAKEVEAAVARLFKEEVEDDGTSKE